MLQLLYAQFETVPDNFCLLTFTCLQQQPSKTLQPTKLSRTFFFELIWHTTPPVTKIGEYMKKQSPHLSVSKFRRICDFESICNVQSQQAVSRLRTLHSVGYSNIYYLANFMTGTPVDTSFESP